MREAPDILRKIIADKKAEVELLSRSIRDFQRAIPNVPAALDFRKAIHPSQGLAVIAEVKKASPSVGLITDSFDPAAIANDYAEGGADAVSVLTDLIHFKGAPEHLAAVRKSVSIPVLRKDFILCEAQILQARALGADSFLLIAAILDMPQARDFLQIGRSLGMEPLFEAHDEAEAEFALEAGAWIVGVNNRNLRTFDLNLETAARVGRMIPKDRTLVGESGVKSPADAGFLRLSGCAAVLVGEYLMRKTDKAAAVRELKEA